MEARRDHRRHGAGDDALCACSMIRARRHADVQEFARYTTVPVINGLTETEHPCQVLADVMTLWERHDRKLSNVRKLKIVFSGRLEQHVAFLASAVGDDGSSFRPGLPERLRPGFRAPAPRQTARGQLRRASGRVHDPQVAAMSADVLYTDVWTSMGQESEESKRREVFKPFQLNEALLARPIRKRSFSIVFRRAAAKRSPTR